MTPDEWKRVREVFDAALDRDPAERAAFLDAACAGDARLCAEVVSLLNVHGRTGDFIEAPAYETAAHLLADEAGASLEGRLVGPYIIRHEIGRGGMGVVYLADDTRLSRRVALKALPPDVGRDAARRERLRQEARAAAALTHPGIATVYALEKIGDDLYLACEYVPGRTLRQVLASGPLPAPQVVDIALQLARALTAAHMQGVVHRDLKAENIVRTPAGVVKILDFGVARAENLSPTHLTEQGAILGTPGYMAPEQARGQHVDFRVDLFAFGVLIYELASGSNPFSADTVPATIARILEVDPPPLSSVCPAAVPDLDRIVASCLRKNPAERYQSTHDLVADLERLQVEVSASRDRADSGSRPGAAARVARASTPRWWWEFHQLTVSAVYVLTMYPAWRVRSWVPQPWGLVFLLAVLACAAAATTLRLHLWFTSRFYPLELRGQRGLALWWTRVCDAGFAASLLAAALATGDAHPEIAMLLTAVSIAAAVASFMIEPTAARAAFNDPS
ncbi:MAG: serine/threonine protein kinase [Acidobacteria bacterium]|nr:serine/threonine protein kinase [Acidobacteriota bacterium]MBI3261705.1 serine/threonine protein kinase [Acidobacteriota bacterium]